MQKGRIVKWIKKVGDKVEEGDVLCEIATDKSVIEYISLDSGYMCKILHGEGDEVELNVVIAIMAETEGGELVSSRNHCQKEIGRCEDLSTVEETTPCVCENVNNKRQTEDSKEKRASFAYNEQCTVSTVAHCRVMASPLAKKIAKQRGIDLQYVKGSGPNGRIVLKDVPEKREEKGQEDLCSRNDESMHFIQYEEKNLSEIRKISNARLQMAKSTIPHYYFFDEIRVDALMSIKQQIQEKCEQKKITVNDFIVRAVALALKKHPNVNCGFHSNHHTIIKFLSVDICIAVNTQEGIITPIIRQADKKNIFVLSDETKILVKKARDFQLRPEEYQSGSFTISNLGMFGIKMFFAIVNPPQGGILSVGKIYEKAFWHDNVMIKGHALDIGLSFDHRVVDGVEGAKFLYDLKEFLESPALLLIDEA